MTNFLYQHKAFSCLRMFFYILIPVTIMILPATYMDSTSLCLIYHLFHIKCLMCGMTRAFFHLLHFDLSTAISWNPLAPYIFIIVVVIVLLDIFYIIKTWNQKRLIKS